AEEDGRENSYSIPVRPIITKSKGYIANGTEKAIVTYGSHSFNTGVVPAYNAMYAVTETVKDDCDWSEAILDVVEGVYKQTCSYCGAVKTTVAGDATEFEEGIYKYGMSATLANEILPEYLVQISNGVTVTEAYLKVEHYADGDTEPTVQVVTPYKAVAGSDAITYRFYAPGVAAKEMNDTVKITFYALVNGERYVAPTVEKSIVDYYNMAYKAYGNETRGQAPALMATLYSLFNYGAEAQRYFEYNADAPVNAVLPADKVVTEFTAEASAEVEVASDCANDVYTVSGFTPILEDRVVLALAYTLEGDALDSVTFKGSYTDINGADRTFDVSGANVVVTANSVIVYVDVIAAKDIRQMITGALYSGDTQVSDSVTFSFECYATIADEAEQNICAAILNYCDAAKALFYKEPAKAE
ncbi:MAG: hypothetical protein IKY12_04160, partial [Clostridia bacterium]|nr:hypothetical protein [Clostridia bacterium]